MTYNVTADYARQNFEEIIQRANTETEGVTIVKDNKIYVLIDREELEALIETAELLEVPNILSDISEAREEYNKGELLKMEDIFGLKKVTVSNSFFDKSSKRYCRINRTVKTETQKNFKTNYYNKYLQGKTLKGLHSYR